MMYRQESAVVVLSVPVQVTTGGVFGFIMSILSLLSPPAQSLLA